MTAIEPLELQHWLEWAGAKFIALPCGRIKPAEPTVIWPDYAQDRHEVLDFRNRINLGLKVAAPAADEIPLVEEIMLFPNLCERIPTRRVLHARSMVHPLNGRYLYNWTRVAEKLHIDRRSARRIHTNGLSEVCRRLSAEKVIRLRASLPLAAFSC